MLASNNSWRVKTRPCPFFPQGRCLFADACNFLHNADTNFPDETLVNIPSDLGSKPHIDSLPTSPPPTVPSVPVQSPRSLRSPTRSPRLSQLLFALKDVIGADEEDLSAEVFDSSTLSDSCSGICSPESWTIVEESDNSHPESVFEHSPILNSLTATDHVDFEDDDQPTIRANSWSQDTEAVPDDSISLIDQAVNNPSPDKTLSDILSPMSMVNLPLVPFLRDKSEEFIDSGYVDWTSPPPILKSPPRSPSVSSTFDPLSPPFRPPPPTGLDGSVVVPLGGSPVSPLAGDSFSEIGMSLLTMDDVTDMALPGSWSDFEGDRTTKHIGIQLSQDSEGGTKTSSQLSSESRVVEHGESSTSSPVSDAPLTVQSIDSESSSDHGIESTEPEPSTSDFEEMPSLSQDDVNAAITQSSSSPSSFLSSESVTFEAETEAESSPPSTPTFGDPALKTERIMSPGSSSDSPTLRFEDSAEPASENDTLHSLYDIYSDILSPKTDTVASVLSVGVQLPPAPTLLAYSSSPTSAMEGVENTSLECVFGSDSSMETGVPDSPLSRNSTSTGTCPPGPSLSYNRVFTLPNRGRCDMIVTTSPQSPHSWSSHSPIRTHSSAKGKRPAAGTIDGDSEGQELEVSTKVPFGFRNSFVLGRTKQNPSVSNRADTSTVTSQLTRSGVRTPLPDRLFEQHSDEGKPLGGSHRLSPTVSTVGPGFTRLKPLRLSSAFSSMSYPKSPSPNHAEVIKRASMSSSTVSSDISLSNNRLLSSARSSPIPQHIRNDIFPLTNIPVWEQSHPPSNPDKPQSAPLSHSESWPAPFHSRKTFIHSRHTDRHPRAPSRLSEPAMSYEDDEEEWDEKDRCDHAIRRVIPGVPRTAPVTRPDTAMRSPFHAIATPRPTLLFAIASDDVEQVRQVLESGDAGANDQVGPQSALEFAITNDKLMHKIEIIKTLLAFGADPSALTNLERNSPQRQYSPSGSNGDSPRPASSSALLQSMDPATRYYVVRADAPHTRRTSALIHRSFFRPLTRVRYELIGQDCAVEQLFRVLSIHSQQLSTTPIVILLCGPSGHGKSLLARRFGSLLDVPTHTVNMTTLRSTHELWQSYSMDPHGAPSTSTLAEFLIDNEGQRCVVVLDEIEKTEDPKTLWSLLMPWELGYCSPEVGKRHIDVRNVIWLGTSNVGHELVFEYHASRQRPDESMTREEYIELTSQMRPRVSDCLGASLMSRVTTVLPFTPFSLEEKMAICTETLHSLAGELVATMSAKVLESVVDLALSQYVPAEGARSLYRAMSSHLVDMC